ncbi:ATP-binding protein [Mucilaginibacter sp.]|uniref:sensor histidine kinase n=1 Tax=Mucilaginibacter sp. TaxID=1882438 RepID=UPI0035BC5569
MTQVPTGENEEQRLAALHSYQILDTAEEKEFDDLTTLASAICQTPVALISLIDGERQWLKSAKGVDARETPKEYAFCAHTIAGVDDMLVIEDARQDNRFAENPFVTGDTQVVFYAGVPLVNEDGFALGSLCVIDTKKRSLTDEQTSALKILARQVVDKLELRRKMIALEKAYREVQQSNSFTQKFAAMAAHDIRNPLSSISLTSQALKIRLQSLQDESGLKLIDLNLTSIRKLINLLDEMMAYSKTPELLRTKKQLVNLPDFLRSVITLITVPENFEIRLPEEDYRLNISTVAFEQIFINLLSNAIRYNDKEHGVIQIRFRQDHDNYYFEVEDNGIGIAEEFHEKIFGNTFTLKVTDRYNKKGTGIGLSTVKELINVLNGSITVRSAPGQGTSFLFSVLK